MNDARMSRLNPYQRKVAEQILGAVVCEAPPGSGKTHLLINRTMNILDEGYDPNRILCCTFSIKGAEEMRVRLAKMVWPDISDAELEVFRKGKTDDEFDSEWKDADARRTLILKWICTIHALAYRLLKAFGEKFRVLSDHDSFEVDSMLKDSIKELGLEEPLKTIKWYIGLAINEMAIAGNSFQFFSKEISARGGQEYKAKGVSECYDRYITWMKKRKLVDFDMLQSRCLYMLRNNPAFKNYCKSLFDFVMVDETQDCNSAQYEILNYISTKGNLMAVGDVDQSLYAFRGARPEALRSNFENSWPEHFRLPLLINYRSTKTIIGLSSKFIKSNYPVEKEKYYKPVEGRDDAQQGEPAKMVEFNTFDELSTQCISEVLESEKPGNWYILSRTRAECSEIQNALAMAGVPCINKSGGLGTGNHVKKVIAYAKLACDYHKARDNAQIMTEIANVASSTFLAPVSRRRHVEGCENTKSWVDCGCPVVVREGEDYSKVRYYGKAHIEQAANMSKSVWDGVISQTYDKNRGGYRTPVAKASSDLINFVLKVEKLKDSSKDALKMIIDESVAPWLAEDEGDSADLSENGKYEDFILLLNMAKDEQTLEQFLDEYEDLIGKTGDGKEDESVIIGTVHWSKGGERPCVIANLTRMPIKPPETQKGKLPVGRPPTISEERNIAFVAITRAKDKLVVLRSGEWLAKPTNPVFFLELQSCNL